MTGPHAAAAMTATLLEKVTWVTAGVAFAVVLSVLFGLTSSPPNPGEPTVLTTALIVSVVVLAAALAAAVVLTGVRHLLNERARIAADAPALTVSR